MDKYIIEWIVYYGEKESKWEVFTELKEAQKFAKKVNSYILKGIRLVPNNLW
jgi:hypothetical protein